MKESFPGASILVVDDTVENVRLLMSVLADRDYEIRPATSGRQALLAATQAPPDLILLDVDMPDMNGFEVCRNLKDTPGLRDIPVIFLTALTDASDKVRAFELGGADYITKPFQVDEVLARVNAHLGLRRAKLDLAQQYERLRELERLRDDLVKMVVHDMRSPLTTLIAHLRFLREDAGELLNEQSRDDLKLALESSSTLNRMTNDLLDVSRLEQRRMPITLAETDLVAIAGEVCAALGGRDRSRSLCVSSESARPARCDAIVIRRVLENLVDNAIKHTPSGGRIDVVALDAGSRSRVEVRDEGRGVPPEARERIFEKFVTTGASDAKFHSAGLGLAFCKLAIEAHGGSIGIDAATPKGSIFWFELPQ